MKTARNVIDGSFRALYRDARAEFDELKGRDPFIDLQWPPAQRAKPDPFTAEERDKIVAHWAEADFFYFPWVLTPCFIPRCGQPRRQRLPGLMWIWSRGQSQSISRGTWEASRRLRHLGVCGQSTSRSMWLTCCKSYRRGSWNKSWFRQQIWRGDEC